MSNVYKNTYADYINKGLSVIPDIYKSKRPAIKGWTEYCDRLPRPDETEQWSNIGDTGISLCLGEASGLVAIDFDCVDQKIIDLVEKVLPDSPVEKKGSKGWTRFFRYSGEETEVIKDPNGEIIFEILSTGKKTTLPPSIHPNGADYIWTSKKDLLSVNLNELPMIPPFLVSQIESLVKFSLGESDTINRSIDGSSGRNNKISKYLLGTILAGGNNNSADMILEELITYDEENNEVPYFSDPNEHRSTSVYTNALNFYASHLSSINAKRMRSNKEYLEPIMEAVSNLEEAKEKSRKKSIRKVEQKSAKKAGSILADSAIKRIYETINSNSWIKQPELSLGASLAIMAGLTSRKFTFQGMSPNLYICNISPSGSGKNSSLDFTRNLFSKLKATHLLGAGDYVSNAALVDSLPLRPVRLDVMDEVGGKLKTINGSNAEYSDKLGDILAELYTSSNSYYMGRALAGQNGIPVVRGAVDRPNVNILAATTPTGFREGVTKDSIAKGLLGRFLFFFGEPNNKASRVNVETELDKDTMDHLYMLAHYNHMDNEYNLLQKDPKEFCELDIEDDANQKLDDLFSVYDKLRLEKIGSPEAPIAARLYQQLVKVTMLHCLARPFKNIPKISLEDVTFGDSIINIYYKELEGIVSKYIFNSPQEKYKYEILDLIKSHGLIEYYNIVRKTPHLTKRVRDSILDELLEAEYINIVIDKDESLNKKVAKYYVKDTI